MKANIILERERTQAYAQGLRQAGRRVTMPRLAICRLLAQSTEHPSAAQVYERLRVDFPSLSLATVYNTLNALLTLGLIVEIGNIGDNQRRYDPNTKLHANLVCTNCHQVRDLEDASLESLRRRVARQLGYRLRGARVVFYGECPSCSERSRRKPATSGRHSRS